MTTLATAGARIGLPPTSDLDKTKLVKQKAKPKRSKASTRPVEMSSWRHSSHTEESPEEAAIDVADTFVNADSTGNANENQSTRQKGARRKDLSRYGD